MISHWMKRLWTRLEKIRDYRVDYNNRPVFNVISFIPVVGNTSGRLHCEFVRIFFFRITVLGNRPFFFPVTEVQVPE
jgi:hypothetical protein